MDLRRWQIPQWRQRVTALLGALMVFSLVIVPARADHLWGSYHLTRPSTTEVLPVGDNLTTAQWDAYLGESISEWNQPGVILLQSVPGSTTPKQCKPKAGTIQACNATYGRTGWLGIAQIWLSDGHSSQGTAKQNDTYFNMAAYNTPAWRQMVICQEVAHTFGLGHVNETYDTANTGSCMDYTNDPDGPNNNINDPLANTHPNQHDYDLLTNITHYGSHTATTTTTSTGLTRAEEEVTGLDPKGWGHVTERDDKGRPVHYEREIGPDLTVVTFVIPVDAPGDAPSDGSTSPGDQAPDAGHAHDGGHAHGGHSHDTTVDAGGHAHEDDQGKKADNKRDGGKKANNKRDGGEKANKDQDRRNKRDR